MSSCEQWKPVLAMVAVNIALAIVNILLKKVLDEGMNQLLIITYRQSISAIFLFPIAHFLERKSRPKLTARILCYLFFSSLVGVTFTQYFFLLGLQYTSATFTCAFINMVPVNTFIMALPFGVEKVNMKSKNGIAKVLGTLVCIGGVILLMLYRGMPLMKAEEARVAVQNTNHATHRWTIGSIVLTAGSLMWSSWFLIQARIGKSYPCQCSSTAILSFFSAVQSAVLSLIIDRNTSTWIVKGKLEVSSVIFALRVVSARGSLVQLSNSGMVGSGLCYVVMSWCVKQRGPVFTAAFSPFIQIFVVIFDVSILHEQIHIGSVLGSLLVIIGLYILLWGKTDEAKDSPLKHDQTVEKNGDCTSSVANV